MDLFKSKKQVAHENFATEPVRQLLLKMALPSIIAMLMQAMYNTVDSMYVARISDGSLAAVTLAFPVQMIIGAFSTGIGVGINSSISRNLGARKEKEASAAAANGLFLGLITMAVFVVFALVGVNTFVSFYTKDPEVVTGANIYIRTVCLLAFGSIFSQLTFSVLQGSGNMVLPMFSQMAGGLVVVLLDPVLIFTAKLGILGAAIASSSAQAVSMLIGLYGIFVVNKKNLDVTFKGFKPDLAILKDILEVGIPSALTQATTSIVAGIVNKEIAVFGTSAISIYGAFSKLNTFAMLPVFGVTRGMNPILGYCCGAKNSKRFKETVSFARILANAWTFGALLVFQLAPALLLGMMNITGDNVAAGTMSFRILSLSLSFMGANIVMTQLFPPVKKSYITMTSALLRQVVFLIPFTMLLSRYYGMYGIWAGIIVADILNFFYIIAVNIWLDKKVLSTWDQTERSE